MKTKHIFLGGQRACSKVTNQLGSLIGLYWYHPDHIGSTSVITDVRGRMVQNNLNSPYGTAFSEPTVKNPYLFTGKELDSTGLYYYGARYYDPVVGRFITADNFIAKPYNPQYLNRYSYCMNNPLRYIDPTGNTAWDNTFPEHSWDNPFSPFWNNAYSWGGYSSFDSFGSWENYRRPVNFEELLQNSYIQSRMNLIAHLSSRHQFGKANQEWQGLSSQYDILAVKMSPIGGIPLHPAVIASKAHGLFKGVEFDMKNKNLGTKFAAVFQGQPVEGKFKGIEEDRFIRNISFLILISSDSSIVDKGYDVISNYIGKEALYLFHLAGISGYQCWEGAEGVMDDIVR